MVKKKSSIENEYRKKAELKLSKQHSKGSGTFADRDPAELLHELQVHKVELELQNDELRQQRDRAEAAVRKYSDLYSEIYDFTPVAYFSLSEEALILEANLKGCELLGTERAKLLNMNFTRFLATGYRQVFSGFLKDVFSDLGRRKCEVQIVSKNSVIYTVIEASVSEKEDRCLAMVMDVTELRKSGEDLMKSEQRLRLLLSASSELIYQMNPDWSEMLQLNSKGFLANTEKPNKNWFDEYIPLKEQPAVNAAILEAIRKKSVFELEHMVNRANGSVGWVYSQAIPVLDPGGEIVEWFGAANDISERKEAEISLMESNRIVKQQLSEIVLKEKKLIRAKEALEHSQKKLNITLRNAKIGTWEWDLGTNELRFDKRTEEIFGLEPNTFNGTISTFEDLVHEDDLFQVRQAVEKAREGNPEQTIYRTKPVNGSFNWLSVSSVVIRDRQGNPKIISGVVFDISNLKAVTELALKNMFEELTRSNNDLQQFAYVASHDLQEPLRMVTSFTQLLQMQYSDKLDDRAKEYINFAVDGSKRMYELVNGLLAYSRIQTKGANFNEVDLEAILHQVQDNLLMLITEREAEIVADKLPQVYADSSQMIQLLQNLIENGIKFCKSRPLITVSGRVENGMHIISVRDNGIGIAPQYHERIFRIFQRLHPQQEFKGTGIGLAVSRRIVERHGGKLWVESVPGEGSTFSFSIPQKRTD